MDTSGTNIGQATPSTRPDNYTKEELAAILKFGAANIFNKEADQAKLEELDLDDVINQAEEYNTATAPTGTSLGGEEFLNQFAVQDVKADMTSWDDIIPLEDREAVDRERKKEEVEAQYLGRAAAQLAPGAYQNDGMKLQKDNRSSSPADSKKASVDKKPVISRQTDAQRSMTLKDRDLRTLVRALQRFGDIRHRYDAIVADAKLESKNRTVITQTIDDLLRACRKAISDKQEALEGMKSRGEEISVAAKNKAPMITFQEITNINAETTILRADHLKTLHQGQSFLPLSLQSFTDSLLLSDSPQSSNKSSYLDLPY